MIIDTHAHLDDNLFNINRHEIIKECINNGIIKIINPSTSIETFPKIKELGESYDSLFTSYGIHPLWTNKFNQKDIHIISNYIENDKKAVAIGEIGLDFKFKNSQKDIQIKCFIEQIKLAVDLKIPVLIHCRKSFFQVYKILKKYWNRKVYGIMHSYSGSYEMAKNFINLGFFISISGTVTYHNAKKILLVIEKLPLDFIVVETDSPYLTPSTYKNQINTPLYIKEIVKKIAELKRKNIEYVENILYKNTLRIFNFQ